MIRTVLFSALFLAVASAAEVAISTGTTATTPAVPGTGIINLIPGIGQALRDIATNIARGLIGTTGDLTTTTEAVLAGLLRGLELGLSVCANVALPPTNPGIPPVTPGTGVGTIPTGLLQRLLAILLGTLNGVTPVTPGTGAGTVPGGLLGGLLGSLLGPINLGVKVGVNPTTPSG